MLVFSPPLQLYAGHNMATEGAAIFVEDIITYNICVPILDPLFPYQDDPVYCFFYRDTSSGSSGGVHLLFINNTASIAGTTLYGGMLDTCPLITQSQLPAGTTGLQEFLSISETLQDAEDLTPPIASDPLRLCFCNGDKPDCGKLTTNIILYIRRGQPFNVTAIALGQANGSVPIIVRAQVPS